MSEIRIMDTKEGDLKLEWNSDNDTETDLAKKAFEKAKKDGMLIYKMKKDGSQGTQIKDWDPNAERIIATPALIGG